jgi:fatty acid-binding protein DegV
MEKLGFVTDSTAYLDPAFIDKHQIEVASLIVNFEGESIQEVDLYGEYDQFYDKLRRVTYLPTTSQPSLGVFLELYQKLGRRVDSIISIHSTGIISDQARVIQGVPSHLIKAFLCQFKVFFCDFKPNRRDTIAVCRAKRAPTPKKWIKHQPLLSAIKDPDQAVC